MDEDRGPIKVGGARQRMLEAVRVETLVEAVYMGLWSDDE